MDEIQWWQINAASYLMALHVNNCASPGTQFVRFLLVLLSSDLCAGNNFADAVLEDARAICSREEGSVTKMVVWC